MPINNRRLRFLLESLGIDHSSFADYLEQVLIYKLVLVMADEIGGMEFFEEKTALKDFRDMLNKKTGKKWLFEDLTKICEEVKLVHSKHFREPISYAESLKLLWNAKYECAQCGKKPPEVNLELDHIYPSSKGGKSKAENLQFLCRSCNAKKSNKIYGGLICRDLVLMQ